MRDFNLLQHGNSFKDIMVFVIYRLMACSSSVHLFFHRLVTAMPLQRMGSRRKRIRQGRIGYWC